MIKLQNYTPDVYYNQSRDFQLIGRLYDVVLNSAKTNADMIYDIPSYESVGSELIELLASTLGFKVKHNYNVNQLIAICSSLSEIIRYKGSKKAVELAGNALLHSEGITDNFSCSYDTKDNKCELTVYFPEDLSSTALFTDLLDYILPAGISCNIIKAVKKNITIITNSGVDITVVPTMCEDTTFGTIIGDTTDLSNEYIKHNISMGTVIHAKDTTDQPTTTAMEEQTNNEQ